MMIKDSEMFPYWPATGRHSESNTFGILTYYFLYPFRRQKKYFVRTHILLRACYMHAPSHPSPFDQISVFVREYQTVKLLVVQLPSSQLLSSYSTYSWQQFVLKTTSVSVPPLTSLIKFHIHIKERVSYSLYVQMFGCSAERQHDKDPEIGVCVDVV